MEKIKIGTNEFELVVNGITDRDKSRSFTIASEAQYAEIEAAFADTSNIKVVSEGGEVLTAYLDGVGLKSIRRDYEAGTYTIEVSTDAMVVELKEIRALLAAQAQ
ncbi:MAG TPA: hypothetical protein GXX75_09110 [Clostridiales bacterium]|nr:hypothetical protein [Clostridiales bacterium]